MAPSPSSSCSDRDEDLEALRRACTIAGADPADLAGFGSDSDSGGESSGSDDVDLLRRLQERFSIPSSSFPGSPPFIRPLDTRPPPDSDEEDDFETLRAIQRRFSHYGSDAWRKKSVNPVQESETPTPNLLADNGKCSAVTTENPDSGLIELHQARNEACNLDVRAFMRSRLPKSAQTFIDALKKNRSCQKFIRKKLLEIEAKIEENKELKERIKCLMDFQVACKKKVGRILCQNKDPRVKLIAMQKARTGKSQKTSWKKVPALCFGPVENSHVSKYKMVLKRFPVSLTKLPWSNIEREKLAKGIKQQYQETLILNSMNLESDAEGFVDSNLVSVLSGSGLEVTPEKIRSFLPLVNWDRLASMYLTGRSGAECEARWLNCEDPLINHNQWTILEEKKLLFVVQERGLYNWIDISIALGTHRTPFQCLVRYQRSLNPHILNKDWTEDEDARLRAAVEAFGDYNWQMVASSLEGRTGPQCSNRWRKSLNPDRRKVGRWSVDEDKRLKVAVMLFGAKNWNKIAHFAPGRTQVQCRERWLNCLDPSLNLKAWTKEEDAKLLAAIAEHGYCWSKVAACVPPRTDSQCRRRWKILLPHEVPLLRAARQMKKTVLISNFVDRESERPAIGPSDFIPLLMSPAAGNDDSTQTRKKRSSNQPKKLRVKSTRPLKEKPAANGVMTPSGDIDPANSVREHNINSNTAESGRIKRSRKKASRHFNSCKESKEARAESRRCVTENLSDGTVDTSAGMACAEYSLVPHVNCKTIDSGKITRTRKKASSGDQSNESTVLSRRPGAETVDEDYMVNTSDDIIPADLSLVPMVNPSTAANGSIKRNRKRTLSHNQKSRAESRKSREEDRAGVDVVTLSTEIVHCDASLVHSFTCDDTERGSTKRTRKKTASDSLQTIESKKSNAKSRRCHRENKPRESIVDDVASENLTNDSPDSVRASSAVGKRIRNQRSRRTGAGSKRLTSCENSRTIRTKNPRAEKTGSPEKSSMAYGIMGSNSTVLKEKSGKLISEKGYCSKLSEDDQVAQKLEQRVSHFVGIDAPMLENEPCTVHVHEPCTEDETCEQTAREVDDNAPLHLLLSHSKANRKRKCLDNDIAAQVNGNSFETLGIQNSTSTANQICEETSREVDDNVSLLAFLSCNKARKKQKCLGNKAQQIKSAGNSSETLGVQNMTCTSNGKCEETAREMDDNVPLLGLLPH